MPLTPSTNAQVISDMGTFSFPMMASAKYDKGHEPGQAVIVTLNDL